MRARQNLGLSKLLANVVASVAALRRLRARRFTLSLDGNRQGVETAQLSIGSNRYRIAEGNPGDRGALDDGVLSAFALAPLDRAGLIRAALRMVPDSPDMVRDFALETTACEVRIEGKSDIFAALDGERTRLVLPIDLRIRPRALAIVVPV